MRLSPAPGTFTIEVIDMHDIRTLLKLAARRLEINTFIEVLHWVAVVVAALALGLIIADRAPAATYMPWKWVGPALAAATLLAAFAMWYRRRPSELHVAVAVDERLDLREKISTALLCEGREDVFARAAVEDAVNAARDPRSRELIRRRFAFTAPRGWWATPAIVLLVMIIGFFGQWDLFRDDQTNAQNLQQVKNNADESLKAIARVIAEKPELSKELAKELGDLSKDGPDPNALKTPEQINRDAMKKATELNKKLDDLINGDKSKTIEAVEKSLNQIKSENGPAKELSEALAKGDFTAAQKALNDLKDKAAKGELTEEQKKALAEQLDNLAKQLEQLANDQKKLEDALKQAGLDPQLAKNPQALQQAMQQNKNLNEQQKQQLQQMAQAQQAASQACKGMSQACKSMGQGMKGGQSQMGQFQQGASKMGDQLSQMETLQQLLQEAKAAQGQCQGVCKGLGDGLSEFFSQKTGVNKGGRGQAAGGKGQIAPTPTGTKQQKAETKTQEGDIIAKELFEGEIIRGESKAKLVEAKIAEARGYDEGMTEDQLPRQYQEAHKHYFGELDKLTKALPDDAGKKSDAKPADAKPADDKPADEKPADAPKPGS